MPLSAQDEGNTNEIVVTAALRNFVPGGAVELKPPVIGLRRQADSAVRTIEIISDSREESMRKREVQAMLLDAIDRAKKGGFSLVTGQFELVEVTRANWQDQFPGLAQKAAKQDDEDEDDEDDEDDDDDEDGQVQPSFEDDGSNANGSAEGKNQAGWLDWQCAAKNLRFREICFG